MSDDHEENAKNSAFFRPDKELIVRQLASPCHFNGELILGGSLFLSHVFPAAHDFDRQFRGFEYARLVYSAFSWDGYVIGIRKDRFLEQKPDDIFRKIIIAASVRFGKRIDDLGTFIENGLYSACLHDRKPCVGHFAAGFWNNHSRQNFPLARPHPLSFDRLESIVQFVLDPPQDKTKVRDTFIAAGNFYVNALRGIDVDIEKAYLDLVFAMELLSDANEYTDEQLYGHDAKLKSIFSKVSESDQKYLKKSLRMIAHRYRTTFQLLVDKSFFAVTEVHDIHIDTNRAQRFPKVDRDLSEHALKAEECGVYAAETYKIRSKYVHAGAEMVAIARGAVGHNAEVHRVKHEKTEEMIPIPTFVGLERMVRYALLNYLKMNECPI